jgi:hypothetical protein
MSEDHPTQISKGLVLGGGLTVFVLAVLVIGQGLWTRHSDAKF